mgnify:CR=1 FL=1
MNTARQPCQRLLQSIFSAVLLICSMIPQWKQVHAFVQVQPTRSTTIASSTTQLYADAVSSDVEDFLQEKYPAFMSVLSRNEKACKVLRESSIDAGFTVFAPNEEAFIKLGEKRVAQLGDLRNSETVEKIGAYHVINEPVNADDLFNAGAVITMGGEVPITRSVSGGFMGIGGKEDGGVTINGAKVVESYNVGSGVVHEVDDLISPNLLWRYLDQLRITGSQ